MKPGQACARARVCMENEYPCLSVYGFGFLSNLRYNKVTKATPTVFSLHTPGDCAQILVLLCP